jgi:hypothetical protein
MPDASDVDGALLRSVVDQAPEAVVIATLEGGTATIAYGNQAFRGRDSQLVDSVDQSPVDRAVVRSIASLAHEMGRRVIAPSVKSPNAVGELRRLGVDCGCGPHWGPPRRKGAARGITRRNGSGPVQ